ncbi:hypothetical protein BDV24DRAFT_161029 [Aspergillus arachidicola]|uniref:Uncharacterized protein n=1 Tax=Aspergillus arachidicola TaxID=656916 RepID=A0A5N6YJM2_9EURO|nr:hypothetical protein BDV24DRAFT_161029 [Aspergillus arachidicola]
MRPFSKQRMKYPVTCSGRHDTQPTKPAFSTHQGPASVSKYNITGIMNAALTPPVASILLAVVISSWSNAQTWLPNLRCDPVDRTEHAATCGDVGAAILSARKNSSIIVGPNSAFIIAWAVPSSIEEDNHVSGNLVLFRFRIARVLLANYRCRGTGANLSQSPPLRAKAVIEVALIPHGKPEGHIDKKYVWSQR